MSSKRYEKQDFSEYVLRGLIFLVLLFMFLLLFANPGFDPLYVGNHSNARRAACQSNMKQLGLALVQYSQDNDDTLPIYATTDGHGWREAIYPFVKSTGIYSCPDDARGGRQYSPDNLPKSYGANAAVMTGCHLTALSSLSQTLIIVDTRGYSGEEWNIVNAAFLPSTGRELYAHIPTHLFYEHPEGRLNALFADGHVKWLAPMDTLAPVNLWTRDNAPFTGQDLANAQAILKRAQSN